MKSNKNESHKSHRHLFVDGHKKRGTRERERTRDETHNIKIRECEYNQSSTERGCKNIIKFSFVQET